MDETPRKPKDFGCCLGLIIKLFTKMYPAEPKKLYTPQGESLRGFFKCMMYMNLLGFVVSIVYVGFVAMIFSMFLGLMSYSGYLTLREWVIILYNIALIGAAGQTFWYLTDEDK